jgi:hypothetical protein
VLSLETELIELRRRGALDERTASRLIAIERGELFPIGLELRAAAYIAVAMIVTGVGILVARNFARIGPLSVALGLGVAAVACYVPAIRALQRNEQRSAVGEYVLLLGALLLATDIGFIETQFHPLGGLWTMHLLMIAIVHAIGAYVFDSKLLLSASLTALASWFGFQGGLDAVFGPDSISLGSCGLAAAAAIAIWRGLNSRFPRFRAFAGTFDFFIANVALMSAIIFAASSEARTFGVILALIFASASIAYGIRTRAFSFVVYGVVYGVIAIVIVIAMSELHSETLFFAGLLIASVGGALTLWFVRQWMRRAP